jgi:hypothetical protein
MKKNWTGAHQQKIPGLIQGLLWLPKSRSQKNLQVPVLKVKSQLKFLQGANF